MEDVETVKQEDVKIGKDKVRQALKRMKNREAVDIPEDKG